MKDLKIAIKGNPLFAGLFFVFLGLLIFGTSLVSAQETQPPTEAIDEISDLKYPIDELGGCSSFAECNTYCEDPVNHASCIDYAKKKGFYEDDPVTSGDEDLLEEARVAIDCDSVEGCYDFCSKDENFDRCSQFARDNEIKGGYVDDPDKTEYLQKAKEVLGCDSAVACANFCGQSDNFQKCEELASDLGLIGGEVREGPGGCTSPETCSSFCRDPNNFNQCRQHSPGGGNFAGPGGCNSPESCRSHCEQNPLDCRSYAPGSNGIYVPVTCGENQFFGPGGICTPVGKTKEAGDCGQSGKFWNGSSCLDQAPPGVHPGVGGAFFQPREDMGGCKTPGECYDYCKSNPGKCGSFNPDKITRPPDTYVPNVYYTPGTEVKFTPKADMGNCDGPGACYDYCKSNPGKCQGFDSSAPRPTDRYLPGTYYTPPAEFTYFTPPATSFYVTPIYYTPPEGSNYTTPSYYTPGSYYTPNYYTPFNGSNYTTPTYYTPGSNYTTPTGNYPTPSYLTPSYYTPPSGSNYTTPSYYTPPPYTSPYYYTPPVGSNYTTPTYNTPPAYTTPNYAGSATYPTPNYFTPGSNYSYPSPSGGYSYPSPSSGTSYNYPTPSYVYPSPSGTGANYYTPNSSYTYPSPTDGYSTPSSSNSYVTPPNYPTPSSSGGWSYSYPSPSYATPSYATPTYNTPTYETPSYGTPSYGTPEYPTPSVQGASTVRSIFQSLVDFLSNLQ